MARSNRLESLLFDPLARKRLHGSGWRAAGGRLLCPTVQGRLFAGDGEKLLRSIESATFPSCRAAASRISHPG